MISRLSLAAIVLGALAVFSSYEVVRALPDPQVKASSPAPTIDGCKIFPNPASPLGAYNADVSGYPLDPNSSTYIASYQGNLSMNLDLPMNRVPANQPMIPITFDLFQWSGGVSDPGPYPIPKNVKIESQCCDQHVAIIQAGTCLEYDIWKATPPVNGQGWQGGAGAIFNLTSGALRGTNRTAAQASGLPIIPGLAKCGEVNAGRINHALEVVMAGAPPQTMPGTQKGFISPATSYQDPSTNPNLLPYGARLRLKASFDLTGFTGQALTIATTLKRWGMFVADDGPQGWEVQGEADASCWNQNELDELSRIPSSAFEVVQTGSIVQ